MESSTQGNAKLVTPLGGLALAQSELRFGYAPGTNEVATVRGKAFVPTPLSGQEVSIDEPVMALESQALSLRRTRSVRLSELW